MKHISQFFFKNSNIWICIILTILMVLYAAIIMGGKSELILSQLEVNESVPGLWFGIDLESLNQFFGSLDQDGLIAYKTLIGSWDMIFPIIYCSMYIFWISLIFKKNTKAKKYFLNLFPLIPATFDWIENGIELNLLKQYSTDHIQETTVDLANAINIGKWCFSYANYAIILVGLFLLIKTKISSNKEI